MKLILNGEITNIDSSESVPSLKSVLKQLGFNPKLIVVEFNGAILNPQLWEEQEVKDGDILEIVTIVGGGS